MEKGETPIPGSADFMNRVLYLASPRAQPEGQKVLDKLLEVIGQAVASDEQPKKTRRLYSQG